MATLPPISTVQYAILIGFNQLKNMFPNMQSNTIKEALASANGCIELVTEALLDIDGKYKWHCFTCHFCSWGTQIMWQRVIFSLLPYGLISPCNTFLIVKLVC